MKEILNKLDKAFENKTRLGIMSVLMVNEWVEFKVMKELLDLTDGNLASHTNALEKKEYIDIQKIFVGKKPQTSYRATDFGKLAFTKHLNALEELLKGR